MDVCIHVPTGAAEVYLLDLPAAASLPPEAPREPLDRALLVNGALSAAEIYAKVLDPGVGFESTGRQLFDALLQGRVLSGWNARRTEWMDAVDVWEQGGRAGPRPSFRTFLCFQDPALAAIPWELLLNSNANLFSTEATPWLRADRLTLERKDRALYRVRVLVINGADPNPASGEDIQAEQECVAIKKILDRRPHEFEVEVVTAPKNIPELEKAIRDYAPHILHFIGHAEIDSNGKPELLLHNGTNHSQWKQTAIEALLPNLDFLRLSYLNACRTGLGAVSQDAKDATRSLAGTFLSRSLSVIGMHSDIRGKAALCCAENFYEGLLDGASPDQALSRARRALANQFQSREPYLPSMTVRTFPDRVLVLRPQPDGLRTEDFGVAINELTRLFVDHKGSRRDLHEAIFCDRADREKRGVLITGDDGTGKTWLIQWVLHAFALRGVRVHYLSNPKGSWLDVLRQIRDAGGTALSQGGCTPEQADRFNWILQHLSNGTEPPPFPSGGANVIDAGEPLTKILQRQPTNSIDVRLCGAMRQCLEAGAEDHGLVLALDAWDLGPGDQKETLFPDSFRAIYDHLLTPLLQSRSSNVRIILSVTPAFWKARLARFYEVPVPYFNAAELPDLAEQLLRNLVSEQLDQDTVAFIRRKKSAMTARNLRALVDGVQKCL